MTNTTSKSRKWLIGGIILLFALNLFLGGFLIARMMRPDPFSVFPKMPLHKLMHDLSPESREKVKAVMAGRRPALHKAFQSMKQAQDRLQREMRAENPNRANLTAAFDDLRRSRADIEANLQDAFVEVIMTLPAKERQELSLHWYRPKNGDGRQSGSMRHEKHEHHGEPGHDRPADGPLPPPGDMP